MKIKPWAEWRLVDRYGRPSCDTFPTQQEALKEKYVDDAVRPKLAPHRAVRVVVMPGKKLMTPGRWIDGTWVPA